MGGYQYVVASWKELPEIIKIRTDTVFLTVYQGAEKFNLKKYEILI